ncbi:hypothetical protein KIN20_014431 [Parelaphostrongylus tenuis]|uniref:Receptor ligand binding region domain-containing protein n=1 Tax=Parelaphostrongylus tenuis TaxID=148309 RepID=A0AAD5MW36_PARTN|nr:hypothetical protein KIN20_014431 [Parelaphostrongylus tenuis]
MMAQLSTFYEKTLLGWGYLADPALSDTKTFPYVTKVVPDSTTLLNCVLQLFATFDWNRVAIFYTSNEIRYCEGIVEDATAVFSRKSLYYVNVVLKAEWIRGDDVYFTEDMQYAKKSVRISNGLVPFWVNIDANDAVDNVAQEDATRMLAVDTNSDDVSAATLEDFAQKVLSRVRADPLYCSTPACMSNDGKMVARWARHLHDVFYLYGLSLNDSLALDPIGGQSNASLIADFVKRSFIGLTGLVTINDNGTRDPLYAVYGLDKLTNKLPLSTFTLINGTPVSSVNTLD